MALSKRTAQCLENALADRRSADEVIAALAAAANAQAASVPALADPSTLSSLSIVAASLSSSAEAGTYSTPPVGSEIDTAINAAVNASQAKVVTALAAKAENAATNTMIAAVEGRLEAAEDKINAILASLKASAQMANP